MPTLKHLTCHVEWSSSNLPLEEYNTTYGDGYVSTYIAIPSTPTPFSIHLTSHGYIAPGLAMFVYMDGVYQVNRNRRNLKIPGEGTKRSHTEVDFRVRQKEELLWDGSFEGKEWRFEKANIVDSPNGEGEQRAPHDGEYVGTIEVVVLRCLPATDDMTKSTSTLSRTAGHRQTKHESSSSSDEPSGTDHPRFPEVFDGAGDPYPALTRKPHAKPKQEFIFKNQFNPKALGLDGSWDEDTEAKNTTGDTFDWDKPNEGQGPDNKDAWGDPPPPVAEVNDKALASWDNPSSSKEAAKTDTWGAWGDKPASLPESEKKEKGAWGVWDIPTIRKEEANKGGIEMTSATTGVWHPSSKIAASGQGSGNGSAPSNAGGDYTTRTEAPRSRGRHSRTSSNHQHQPVMRLRGGAPGSYTVTTPGAGHQTPTVIVNINNGPPADNGPPPPRDWMAEARKEREQSKGKKSPTSPTSPTPPANDPWTTDLPPYDPSQDTAVNGKGDQNGDGGWGRNGNGQQMPGAWDDSGNDGWGNANGQKDNHDWNATGNANDKGNNDSSWGNTGNDPFVDTAKDDAKTNNDGWDNSNNNQDTSWGADNGTNNAKDTGWNAGNENGNAQDTGWGANTDNKDQQDDSWGKENDKANDFSWGADKTEPEAKVGSTDPATRKPSDSKAASWFTFGNSKPKQSKAGSVKTKVSANSKNNDWSFNALNSPKKSKKGTPKPSPVPGAWSPPPASPPPSPKPKKNKKSKSSSSPKPSPTLISPTPQPHPKPYWSTWRIHHSPFTDSPLRQEPPPPPYEDPLYPVPRAVARRHGTSHQVQPGKAAPYLHKKNRPQYMDSMESPYAVFEFHYRDKETLERILSHALPAEPPAHEKLRLRALSKSELIDAFIQTKTKLSSTGPSQPKSKSNKSISSRKASASTTSTGKAATLRSNPKNIQEGPDIEALDQRLRKLETSKSEGEGEGVKGWLEDTHEQGEDWGGNGNGNGIGNEGGTKENNNNGWDADNGNGSTAGNWGGTGGGDNTKKSKPSRKAPAKGNNKKGKENVGAWGTNSDWNDKNASNAGGNGNDWNDTSGGCNSAGGNNKNGKKNDNDNNAWGPGSDWNKKDDSGGDAGGGNGNDWNATNSGGNGNDWNDTSGGGHGHDWGATTSGGGGGGGEGGGDWNDTSGGAGNGHDWSAGNAGGGGGGGSGW